MYRNTYSKVYYFLIFAITSSSFKLLNPGVYQIQYQLCIKEEGDLIIGIEDPLIPGVITELPYTLQTKTQNDSYLFGSFLIRTITSNNVISVRNPINGINILSVILSNSKQLFTSNNITILYLG